MAKDDIAGPPTDPAAVLALISDFLAKTSPTLPAGGVCAQTPLLEGGTLDSLGILQLVMFLGDRMQIEVTDEDFVPENFQTVGSLVHFVVGKRATVPC